MRHIHLPTLHAGQVEIYGGRSRLNAVRCGRRWGKTQMMVTMAGNTCAHGLKVGIFTPEYRQLAEPFEQLRDILTPIKKRINKTDGAIRTRGGGHIDFWTLNDNELAGRGREYDLVLIDEGGFTKNKQMPDIWAKSIKPTMLTRHGVAWVFSTPNGDDSENFFWQVCNDEKMGFKGFHAPTISNPYVPPDELEKERLSNHPDVFRQEYLAEFVDWRGIAFFNNESLTVNGQGVPLPMHCDAIYCVIDSAMKDGSGNDGTACVWFGLTRGFGHPLVVLDWEISQIKSDLLPMWLPNVLKRGEQLAVMCQCRGGFIGAFIEDKASGITLNQYAQRMGLPCQPIGGDITSIGKDGRAISASGPVYRGEVKMSALAYDKVSEYKGQTKNHLRTQVTSYRIGDKDAAKRADDLTDCFTYGVIIGLNGPDGF